MPHAYARQRLDREHVEQVQYFALLTTLERRHPVLRWVHAIPNGANVPPSSRRWLVEEGLRSGVSDVHIPASRGGFVGAYIEFKAPKDRVLGQEATYPSPQQRNFMRAMTEEGHHCLVCDDSILAYNWTRDYLDGRIQRPAYQGPYASLRRHKT